MVGAERLPELSDRPNLPCLDAFLTEMVRIVVRIVSETPQAIPHPTTRDTTVAGFFIPRDVTVFVNLWAIHHDIQYWVEPFTFRPERFLNDDRQLRVDGMLPFSAGIRTCPGEKFGKKSSFLICSTIVSQV